MKNIVVTLTVFALLTSLNSVLSAKNNDEHKALIHAVYALEREWTTPDDVVLPELADFDFIYVMAGPKWSPEDFDLSQDAINKKYVTDHKYEHYDGMKTLIDGVHSHGNHILCSFPGTEFIDIASNPARADKFAAMMAEFILKYDYDGIELDWEHTVTEYLHLDFMKRIRKELSRIGGESRHYWLTTALHHYRKYTPQTAAELSDCVDWINIMFYDMGGGRWGTVASHNSPLDEMDVSVHTDWEMFDPSKLHIGMPNYGFYYKNIRPGETVPEGKTLREYGRYCDYTELPALIEKGWKEVWDEKAHCPYYFSPDGNEFITLESPRSLDDKFEWFSKNKFGGIFWWEYSCDWIKPEAKGERGKHLLIDHITEKINR